jgi:hypothetical protein
MPEAAQADRLAKLRKRADGDYPESWQPSREGDEIAGQVVRYERGNTARGERVIVIVQPAEGGPERSVWLLHTALINKFAERRPKPGELVLIRYLGKRTSAGDNEYADYRVEVDREEGGIDWEGAQREAGIEPDQGAEVPAADPPVSVHAPLDDTPDSDVPADTEDLGEGDGTGDSQDDDAPF